MTGSLLQIFGVFRGDLCNGLIHPKERCRRLEIHRGLMVGYGFSRTPALKQHLTEKLMKIWVERFFINETLDF